MGGRLCTTAEGYEVYFEGDENVLEFMVMVIQLGHILKTTELYF